jgi:MFS family permease
MFLDGKFAEFCAIVAGIFIIVVLTGYHFEDPMSLPNRISYGVKAAIIIFFLPAAISALFYEKFRRKSWLIPLVLSAIIAFTWIFAFIHYLLGGQGSDGYLEIGYVFGGAFLSGLMSLLIIGFGALEKCQHGFTRAAGAATITTTVSMIVAFSAVQFGLATNTWLWGSYAWLHLLPIVFGLTAAFRITFSSSSLKVKTTEDDS